MAPKPIPNLQDQIEEDLTKSIPLDGFLDCRELIKILAKWLCALGNEPNTRLDNHYNALRIQEDHIEELQIKVQKLEEAVYKLQRSVNINDLEIENQELRERCRKLEIAISNTRYAIKEFYRDE